MLEQSTGLKHPYKSAPVACEKYRTGRLLHYTTDSARQAGKHEEKAREIAPLRIFVFRAPFGFQ